MKTLTRHKENKLKAGAGDRKEQATNSYSLVTIQGGHFIMRHRISLGLTNYTQTE